MNSAVPADVLQAAATTEGLLVWLTVAMMAERLPPGEVIQERAEKWAHDAVAALLRDALQRGDLSAAMPKHWEWVEVALSAFWAQHELADRLQGIEANKRAVKKALDAGDKKRAALEKGMFLLRFPHCRNLRHSVIQEMIENARREGDAQFFVRFGRALQEKPISPEETPTDKLAALITGGWLPNEHFKPGLCRLTDEALAEVCNHLLGRNDLNLGMVRKARQRWKLKKAPKPWLKKVEKTAEGIFVS